MVDEHVPEYCFTWEQLVAYLTHRDNMRLPRNQHRTATVIEAAAYKVLESKVIEKCPNHEGKYISNATWS